MFKFGFSGDNSAEDEKTTGHTKLNWFPATEIKLPEEPIQCQSDNIIETAVCDMKLKLRRSDNVVLNLKNEEHENIIAAEAQHSDLVPSIYEALIFLCKKDHHKISPSRINSKIFSKRNDPPNSISHFVVALLHYIVALEPKWRGLKIWECSYDLINYLITQKIPLENKRVLDLGCGAGILGILCLLKGAIVHFQDYNSEVIQLVTIPNVQLNSTDSESIKEKSEFYSGDWAAFSELSSKKYQREEEKYDIILSSETIYNPDNQEKLYQVFKERLKADGIGYVAGKTYYFGVGGGMRQFEGLILEDNAFDVEQIWRSEEGLQREILQLTRRTN